MMMTWSDVERIDHQCFKGLLCHWTVLGVALCHPWWTGSSLKDKKTKRQKRQKYLGGHVLNHKAILLKTNINVTIMISSSSSHRHFVNKVILEMVDFYAGTLLILALASIEIMAMNWIYGTGTIARYLHRLLLHLPSSP